MSGEILSLEKLSVETLPDFDQAWKISVVKNEDNLSYILSNNSTGEGIIVDPHIDDIEITTKNLDSNTRWWVIDTHTHADHISGAWKLSQKIKAPLVMHNSSPSQRVDIRINKDCNFPLAAGNLSFITTPGHTPDGLTVTWGPFVFTGDTILFNDAGRDDLPGGNPEHHFQSITKLIETIEPNKIFLCGHDGDGRCSTWGYQLENNDALKQTLPSFLEEWGSYVGPAPKQLKESLFENFK